MIFVRELILFYVFFFFFFFAICIKGDNFCDFLFALLHAKLFLKSGLLYEKEFTPKFYPCRVDSSSFGSRNNFDSVMTLECVLVLLKKKKKKKEIHFFLVFTHTVT